MPGAELRLTIMSSIAQDEVRKISERVKFGFKRAIESGVVLASELDERYKMKFAQFHKVLAQISIKQNSIYI